MHCAGFCFGYYWIAACCEGALLFASFVALGIFCALNLEYSLVIWRIFPFIVSVLGSAGLRRGLRILAKCLANSLRWGSFIFLHCEAVKWILVVEV